MQPNGSPYPASELTLLRFIGWLSRSRQAGTIKVYLAAVRAGHIQGGFGDPLSSALRVPMVLRGLRRSQVASNRPPKQPITALLMYTIRQQFDLSSFDNIMLWAASCTAFLGFLQASEFTVPPSGFCNKIHLSLKSVSMDKKPAPSIIFLYLKVSKTDQFGKGCSIILARAHS